MIATERPALYYPYLHIRPEQEPWLKATLLLHPSIIRMVPPDYEPEDDQALTPYITNNGSNGRPLLDSISTSLPAARQAKDRLLQRITEDHAYLQRHFTKEHANGTETTIQYAKFSEELLDYLTRHHLAWQTTGEGRLGHRNWRGLHPRLGNAIMSTIATSIATDQGLPIITPTLDLHEQLLGSTENEIYDRLINVAPTPHDLAQQTANELGELVITTTMNLNRLRIEDLIALQQNKQDLRAFRDHLLQKVQRIGTIPDPATRTAALKPLAQEIDQEWHDYKAALPQNICKTLFGAASIGAPALTQTLLAHATNVATILLTTGLHLVLLGYAGKQVFTGFRDRQQSPLKYLSMIKKKASKYETLSTSPLNLTLDTATNRRSKPSKRR